MKYLVIGATGNIGSRVAQRLVESGTRPSIFVRSAKRARALFGDHVDVHTGDLDTPGRSLATALAGVDGVFLVTDGWDLEKRDRAVSFTARDAGVGHVVKLSTLDVRTGIGTGPWHARGEEAVRESGVAFTFIQAAGFMSNVLGWSESSAETACCARPRVEARLHSPSRRHRRRRHRRPDHARTRRRGIGDHRS